MRTSHSPQRQLLLLATSLALAGCGAFGADGERYDKLDRLRVLAIQSEPAAIAVGETALLSANVYEPANRALEYKWSWCPSRADAAGGFECNISEKTLQQAWRDEGLTGAAPQYDLGTDPDVAFTNPLNEELVAALCKVITGSSKFSEQAALACFKGLEASVKLEVRSTKDEVTAIRALTLVGDETTSSERNVNPPSNFAIALRDRAKNTLVKEGQALKAGHSYAVTADLDRAIAETFLPEATADEPKPKSHRETLVMSWFLTTGEIVPLEEGGGFDDDVRTTFVDGHNEFASVTKNGWSLPLNAGSNAELHLVLRDERGGVGWTQRSFKVTGGEK